jgi:hypothetical protein
MTKQELNRDTKRLLKAYKAALKSKNYYEQLPAIQKELKRLYMADSNFKYMNKTSILILLRLNLRLREIELHHFGINIDI